jgi:hypothetical protein
MIRVILPAHLKNLAGITGVLDLEIATAATQRSVLDAVERAYPMLRGTIRDHASGKRRPFVRFFACGQDVSHEQADAPLPEAVSLGREPFMVIGAIAGG